MNISIRKEHPYPQFQRQKWMNLNGEWAFAFDFGESGMERGMYRADPEALASFDRRIQVPFCPESSLSGIGYVDFIRAAWYRRSVTLQRSQLQGRVLLHFGAVDYESRVFVNGQEAGMHRGGYSSFCFDITGLVYEGENVLTVYVRDDVRSGLQPKGKQAGTYFSRRCDYTRTTGIWQTVWMEFVPDCYLKSVRYYPDLEKQCFFMDIKVRGSGILKVFAFYEGRSCGEVTAKVCGENNRLCLPLKERHLWECGRGRLYKICLTLTEEKESAQPADRVFSYAGLRQVRLDGYRFLLNEKPVFLRMVLDQGFYRKGIYTAPSDQALQEDICLAMDAGFNGARLHQKIFEPRFLYHCDRAGYLVWGEHGNWGLDLSNPESFLNFMPEWLEAMERDFNHPAIIGWCPFNETRDYCGRRQDDRILSGIYHLTKAMDDTRPCIDTSGHYHVVTDIFDVHNYEQNVEKFAACYRDFASGGPFVDSRAGRQQYKEGLPLFVSEYGGIKWNPGGGPANGWGYGDGPATQEEFIARYRGLTDVLLDNPRIMGFCYTQLYDIEQETNGLYDYDRRPKFDMDIFKEINSRKAAIEDC